MTDEAPPTQPWQCPDCQTWLAPTTTEHRCDPANRSLGQRLDRTTLPQLKHLGGNFDRPTPRTWRTPPPPRSPEVRSAIPSGGAVAARKAIHRSIP